MPCSPIPHMAGITSCLQSQSASGSEPALFKLFVAETPFFKSPNLLPTGTFVKHNKKMTLDVKLQDGLLRFTLTLVVSATHSLVGRWGWGLCSPSLLCCWGQGGAIVFLAFPGNCAGPTELQMLVSGSPEPNTCLPHIGGEGPSNPGAGAALCQVAIPQVDK